MIMQNDNNNNANVNKLCLEPIKKSAMILT